MKKILIIIGLVFIGNRLYAQLNIFSKASNKKNYLTGWYQRGIADGGGITGGIKLGYLPSPTWEFTIKGGTAFGKFYEGDKTKLEGYLIAASSEYYFFLSDKKSLQYSLKADLLRTSATISPYQITLSANAYQSLFRFKNQNEILIHVAPSFIKAKELLNNRFAVEGSLLLDLVVNNKMIVVQSYYKRIFGLCCNQGNIYGIELHLFL